LKLNKLVIALVTDLLYSVQTTTVSQSVKSIHTDTVYSFYPFIFVLEERKVQ